jgi:polyphosphate kinase
VVELMARFDEEANINWAERLEHAGAQVVVRRVRLQDARQARAAPARETDPAGGPCSPPMRTSARQLPPAHHALYTDFGLSPPTPRSARDVDEVFRHITSLSKSGRMKRLMLAPFTMQRRVIEMIRREARHAKEGRPARIKAKMNGLTDEGVIRALQAASQAGVAID